MRRPQRRLHVLIWLFVAPAAALGLFIAVAKAPSPPHADLDASLLADGER